jgi:hypothetical protein
MINLVAMAMPLIIGIGIAICIWLYKICDKLGDIEQAITHLKEGKDEKYGS